MNNKNTITLESLMDEGNWFWKKEIIKNSHGNLFADKLVESATSIQQVIKSSSEDNLIDNLRNLKDLSGHPLPPFIILKNLMISLDVSAEILDRTAMYLRHFKINHLTVDGKEKRFKVLGREFSKQLSNNNIEKLCSNNDFFEDILLLLCFAANSDEFKEYETFDSFKLSSLLGKEDEFKDFLLHKTIESSSQVKQLRAVANGNTLQRYIKDKIETQLKEFNVKIAPNNRYLGIQQFDIVLFKQTTPYTLPTPQSMFNKKKLDKQEQLEFNKTCSQILLPQKWAVIEVAFQETTNSTMERKSKQAANGLFNLIDLNNHKLIYILDGAGYFRRNVATNTIINYSHLTSTVSDEGIQRVINYLKEYFAD